MGLKEEERYAAALSCLGAGPRRLREFVEILDPASAWEALAAGVHPADPKRQYRDKTRDRLLVSVTRACERSGIAVLVRGATGYPTDLADDPEAPAVLFARGDASVCDGAPRVAVVGTRSATPYGLGVASEIGRGLAGAGVVVVSGLARGIDSAAHRGAIDANCAPALGVLGTSLDAPIPRVQTDLRDDIATNGSAVSELPPGCAGAPAWWFVVRNRVIAALAHIVVVVECHARGGALHTVKAATRRGLPVAAVPGSVRSAASSGTNSLLVDGATPVRDVADVLTLLELAIAGRPQIAPPKPPGRNAGFVPGQIRAVVGPTTARVLEFLESDPVPLDTVIRRSGLSLGEVSLALEELSDRGLAATDAGWWSRAGD